MLGPRSSSDRIRAIQAALLLWMKRLRPPQTTTAMSMMTPAARRELPSYSFRSRTRDINFQTGVSGMRLSQISLGRTCEKSIWRIQFRYWRKPLRKQRTRTALSADKLKSWNGVVRYGFEDGLLLWDRLDALQGDHRNVNLFCAFFVLLCGGHTAAIIVPPDWNSQKDPNKKIEASLASALVKDPHQPIHHSPQTCRTEKIPDPSQTISKQSEIQNDQLHRHEGSKPDRLSDSHASMLAHNMKDRDAPALRRKILPKPLFTAFNMVYFPISYFNVCGLTFLVAEIRDVKVFGAWFNGVPYQVGSTAPHFITIYHIIATGVVVK